MSFLIGCLLFLLLLLLHWLEIPLEFWKEMLRVDLLFFFLIAFSLPVLSIILTVGFLPSSFLPPSLLPSPPSFFLPSFLCSLAGLGHSLLFLLFSEVLPRWILTGFCQMLLLMRWSHVFVGVDGVFSLVLCWIIMICFLMLN